MKYYLCAILLFLLDISIARSQTTVDTAMANNVVVKKGDSLPVPVVAPLSYRQVLKQHPYYNFFAAPVVQSAAKRPNTGKDLLFYILSALVLLLAFVKTVYGKYFSNMMTVAFSASLRQKQLREQLMQSPLPSLLLNILFCFVMGLYIIFVYRGQARAGYQLDYWLQLLYGVGVVVAVYLGKYLVLNFFGWVFNIKNATDVYLFVVFMVNKLLGIFMLPVIVVLAFAPASWWPVLVTLSYIFVAGFLVYRYVIAYEPVRREVKVSLFHFFVYLCAFEIIPMILIYREFLKFA